MARKVETVVIEAEGRDKGKTFILTEMPAVPGERWATQALTLLSRAGLEVPESAKGSGMAGLASVRMGGLAELRALQDPALDSWWDCVQYLHAPNQMPQKLFQGAPCQIEEIATVNLLRMKVLEMHVGFFGAGSPSTSGSPSSPATTVS
jgi:hypothetical protein